MNIARQKWVIENFAIIIGWMLARSRLMTREEAERLEVAWDEIFDWLADSRDELKPHVEEARGRVE